MAQLVNHINTEEGPGGDLEVLRSVLTPYELQSLGRSYVRTKYFVPTRAHPDAPDKPPFETVTGLLLAPIDKLRDLFRSFPEQQPAA